ncbi:hypothetical protein RF11_01831 [Thelohanellus kitauei]|uniref:Uncharacterized protein n=1 Tax=Thelohanellus kitauei TaxID=669202 RepID=A0A0C2M7X5_THEKT|nr:hypothetical protein RF11_01831 [Thelohanellus kitauei]
MNNFPVEQLRDISNEFIKSGDFESAIFWLEKVKNHLTKVCIASNYIDEDFYNYIIAMIAAERHKCALGLLKARDSGHLWIQVLIAKCYSCVQRCNKALDVLSFLVVQEKDLGGLIETVRKCKEESPFLNPFVFVSDALFHKASLLEYSGHVNCVFYYGCALVCNPLKFSVARRLLEDELINMSEVKRLFERIRKFNAITNQLSTDLLDTVFHFYQSN